MNIMIIGLGLIGGSIALALSPWPYAEIYAVDRDDRTRFEALNRGAVRAAWASCEEAPLERMDLTFLCLHPDAACAFVAQHGARLKAGSILTDVCGVKQPLHRAVSALPDRPFVYLGGHPMAGKERGGFDNADADLFRGCHYILTPDASVPESAVRLMKALAMFMGCADVILSDPAAHDERIAYTSQLMHVMALALCDQHLLFDSRGFEGGSFRGATRVAALDPKLWCELFYANRDTLAGLTEELSGKLDEYAALLRAGDRQALLDRLTASSDRKKAFDALRGTPSKTPLFR